MSSDAEVVYCQADPVYRKAEGQSQSHLKTILKSPAHYQSAAKHRLIPSPAMIMGTAVHCLALEGQETFDAQFCQRPPGIKFTTKEGKEWREANKKKRQKFIQGELFKKVEAKRKATQRVNEA